MTSRSICAAVCLALALCASSWAGLLVVSGTGMLSTNGHGLNDAGVQAGDGNWQTGPGNPWYEGGYTWPANGGTTWVWERSGLNRYLYGINNNGATVGYVAGATTQGVYMAGGIGGASRQQFQVQGDATYATGINDSNVVVGRYFDGSTYHGFITDGLGFGASDITTVDLPGATATAILGINDLGQYVGSCTTAATGSALLGFFYNGSTVQSIMVPGALQTYVLGINNAGEIVGSYMTSPTSSHGFVTLDGVHFSTLDISGAVGTQLEGVNNFGYLSGTYYTIDPITGDSRSHAFVLTPEPSSVLLVVSALCGLAWRRRKAR